MNILYVEDDVEISKLAKMMFLELDHTTVWCHDVNCAKLALKSGGKIDLVLLDLKLHTSNGIDLLKFMEKIKCKIPVVLISGYLDIYASDVEHFTKIGMILGAYSKPYSVNYLAKSINKMFPIK